MMEGIRRLFSFEGRIGPIAFWRGCIAAFWVFFAGSLPLLLSEMVGDTAEIIPLSSWREIAFSISWATSAWIAISHAVRRSHDLSRSLWSALIDLERPLFLKRGVQGENEFGPPPSC
jgi:uncharacterized membrane protein YhaH (DUF805 family)